ncbi:MAG: Ig-like domain-containing protein, partial [Byssovorax sp.]
GGGTVCSAGGACVQCNAATQCPGTDTECHTRTCGGNTCGANNPAAGTPTSAQTTGDCQKNQCDGAGNIVSAADNTDVPNDGLQCTSDLCTAGVPSNPPLALNTSCSQAGGTVCDGNGSCVGTPQVASTSPSDATTPIAAPAISVTFTVAMNPATLTGQTTAGACSGSIQVSLDGFASCVAFSSAAATMSGGNTTATFTTTPGLLVNRLYKIRVTTAAASATNIPLAAQFTQPTGFTTITPNLCNGSIVMSAIYGGGGNAGAQFKNDYVELHNRGTTTVSLVGLSIQYASSAGTTWNGGGLGVVLLSGSIPAGGYFLVQLASNGAIGASLPTPDLIAVPSVNFSATNGKIALINGITQIPDGACPPAATTVDFIGYGSATCKEGAGAVPVLSNTTAGARVQSGCADVNNNVEDFVVGAPAPRTSATAATGCACSVQNESNAALEADYVDVQFPLSLNPAAGSAQTVFGRIYELGTTDLSASASANVRAQLGYGPATSNPEYEAGWTWTNATFNAGFVDPSNDEYQATFNAPASGTYRYVYRFSLDQGVSWTYADNNVGDGGAGSNAGLTFDFSTEAVMIVP